MSRRSLTDFAPNYRPTHPRDPKLLSAWFAVNGKAGEVLWEKSQGPIAEVFELFRQAYKDGKATELSAPPRFAELWRKHPPTPVSKSWDAEEGEKTGEKSG